MLDILHQEHIHISKLMDVLEEQIRLLQENGDADLRLIAEIAEYIMNYPDIYHHPKEDLIFELLRRKDDEIVPVIDQLISEHKTMAEMAITLSGLLGNSLTKESPELLVEQLQRYIGLTRTHMNVEENILFPRAKQLLTDDDWAETDAGFTSQGDPLLGDVIHKQYRNIYNSIIN
ncbi:MAG: hemerythrin domain-containing protein [Gammaproteobacteria bacterium]